MRKESFIGRVARIAVPTALAFGSITPVAPVSASESVSSQDFSASTTTTQGPDLNVTKVKAYYIIVKPGLVEVIVDGQATNDGDQPAPANDIRVWVDGQGHFCQTPGIPQEVTGRMNELLPGESSMIQASKEVSENCVKDGLIFANVQVDVSEETGDINPENNGITIQPIPSAREALSYKSYVPFSVKAGR